MGIFNHYADIKPQNTLGKAQTPNHSKSGVTSFVLAILEVIIILLMGFAGLFLSEPYITWVIFIGILPILTLPGIGLALGINGLKDVGPRKIFAIIGTVLNASYIGSVFIWFIYFFLFVFGDR